jgi:hypothetical protein
MEVAMTLRAPAAGGAAFDPIGEALRHETAGEMAATLGRLSDVLAGALASLERARAAADTADPGARSEALDTRLARRHATACEALWNVMIQRELCGLRRHEAFLREMKVPRSVELFMGPAKTAPGTARPGAPDDGASDA